MNTKVLLITCLVSFAITACGSGSSSDEPPIDEPLTQDPLTQNPQNQDPQTQDPLTQEPIDAETTDLKSFAVNAIGGRFDSSLSAVGGTINQNASVGNTINDVATGGSNQLGEDIPTDAGIQDDVQSLLSVSLAEDENPASTTTRNGNVITVDPDEAELCREEDVFNQSSAQDVSDCMAFFADVTVRLVASAEEVGTLTYLYQQQPVITLGYAPNSESVELFFGGIKTTIDGIAALTNSDDGQITSPNEMTGAIKFSTTETNTADGQEAGSIAIEVTDPISIASLDDVGGSTSLSMQTGTLLSISADAATGQGSLSFDLGAISAAAPSDSGLAQMNLAGFTGQADVNPTDGLLVVRNFGLSKGPFSLSLNNEEVMRATLGAFGFSVTEGTDMEPGELTIDGNMNLSVMLNQFAENEYADGVIAMALDMMAPTGTSFSRAGNGTTQVGGAGPFTVSLSQTPDIGNPTVETVVVNSGECFTDLFEDDDTVPSTEVCL